MMGAYAPGRYLPVRSRCLHPGQQRGLRWPSSSSSLGPADAALSGHLAGRHVRFVMGGPGGCHRDR